MENKLPADIQHGVEDCVKYCIENQNHLTPHIAVRSAVEVWAQKVAALRAQLDRMEAFLQKKIQGYSHLIKTIEYNLETGIYKDWYDEREAKALQTVWGTTLKTLKHALNQEPESQTTLQEIPDYPKLTPEQIQERKEAIEWIRNPAGGMRWVTGEYDRLYEQVKGGKRSVCYVDCSRCRDICTIDNEAFELGARGISYGRIHKYMRFDDLSEKDAFIKLCENRNVEWLDEGKEVEKC